MKLAISNIAWAKEYDEQMYEWLSEVGFAGIEIAPTRIWETQPYEQLAAAGKWAADLKEKYGLAVPSLQSIWYQRSENMFRSKEEREALLAYTKQAIRFAQAAGSTNLVFGCPRNRNRNEDCALTEAECMDVARKFLKELGDEAAAHGTVFAIEPNPPIYNTNFVNDTQAAFKLAAEAGSAGCKVNVDLGTIIQNGETLQTVFENINLVSHIHISEPGLNRIKKRTLHQELADGLKKAGYDCYISIEMKNLEDIQAVQDVCRYVADVFQ